MQNSCDKYMDIINFDRPVSKTHPPMDVANRAAQFSPFAAMVGHDAAIRETARLTEEKVELDENQKSVLDEQLQIISQYMRDNVNIEIRIEHFVRDGRKAGGAYVVSEGQVEKIDYYNRQIVMFDGDVIQIDDIVSIDGDIFL